MRTLVATLLVLGILLAGCNGRTETTTTTSTPSHNALPEAPATTAYHLADAAPVALELLVGNNTAFLAEGGYHSIGTKTFEPTIGSTASGALFIPSLKRITAGDSDNAAHIIRGTENGTVWQDMGPFLGPVPISRTINSNDPFVYVDPWTNRIYNFDMCGTLSAFCVSYSDDDGETWTTTSIATGESTALDHQSLAAAPAPEGVATVGYPNVLTFCVNRGPNAAGSWCSTSRDGGINWTPLLPGHPVDSQQCAGLSGHVKGAADGAFYRGMESCSGPAVYRSDDGGVTWSEHAIPNATMGVTHDVEVAIDAGGNVYAFWMGSEGLPYLAHSQDRGESWSLPVMVAAPGVTAAGFPTIAAGAPGRIAFAYIGSSLEKGYEGDQGKATWNGYIGVMTDALAAQPLITTVAVNAPEDPLSKGACGNVRCGGFGDFIGITIDPFGRPWVAMAHNESGLGIVGTLLDGPSLKGELSSLPRIELGGPASLEA